MVDILVDSEGKALTTGDKAIKATGGGGGGSYTAGDGIDITNNVISIDNTIALKSEIPTNNNQLTNGAGYITSSALSGYATESYVTTAVSGKQDMLVSGTNIKTINNNSILGSGNISINNDIGITEIQSHYGSISLSTNTVYSGSFTANTTFVLPTPTSTAIFNQIKVMCSISNLPTINFGTSYFFNKQQPILENGYYDIYFDYDNNLSVWVCGAILKGSAS